MEIIEIHIYPLIFLSIQTHFIVIGEVVADWDGVIIVMRVRFRRIVNDDRLCDVKANYHKVLKIRKSIQRMEMDKDKLNEKRKEGIGSRP